MTASPTCSSVLIVDDDAFLGGMLQRMVQAAGVERSSLAADGKAALTALDGQSFDLVLCDLNMPGMDGLEFLRHLAARPPAPPVVLMSGADRRILSTARQLANAQGLSVLGVLNKPVPAFELREILATAAAKRGQPRTFRSIDPLSPEAIAEGIRQGCVRAHYQPKLLIRDGSVPGAEALLRWQDPVRGAVPPVAIVPVAERVGLMNELTQAVLGAVLADAPALLRRYPSMTLSINVSADNLTDLSFADTVLAMTEAAGVPNSALMLEVTESKLIENSARPLEILTRLRLKGIGLSIDDYGTGTSTLQQLQRIPATELKIDRIFVNGASADPECLAMLESSVDLARKLGLSTVAEGVESAEEAELVKRAGCELVQGFHYSRGLPVDALMDWISAIRTS